MKGIKKNDVILVDLSGAIGSEQGKIRYCIVIQNDTGNMYSTTTIIMPITHGMKALHIPTHALIKSDKKNGLKEDSTLLGEQIRTISKDRIIKRVGKITDTNALDAIKKCYLANIA